MKKNYYHNARTGGELAYRIKTWHSILPQWCGDLLQAFSKI